MCHEASGVPYDRPLFEEDVPLIAKHYPNLDRSGVEAVHAAITDHHWPQPAVLITVLEMVDRARRNDTGNNPFATMPFSAMDRDTYERVQVHKMAAFHTVFESMALAQRNMKLLNGALHTHFGLQFVLFCDCGCITMSADIDPFDTEWYLETNNWRAAAEAAGTKIVHLNDFSHPDWRDRDLDVTSVEESSYERMFDILNSMPARDFNVKQLAKVPQGEGEKIAA